MVHLSFKSHCLFADPRENTARRTFKDMKHKAWHKGQVTLKEESVRTETPQV